GLREHLRRLSPSAVMILGYSPRFHREAWHEARRLGQPLLFRGETSDEAPSRGGLKSGLRRAALGRAYRNCGRPLYIGVRSREHFDRLGVPADRLVFSPYCVDTTPFEMDESARERLRPPTRHELGISDDRLVVLYSGKLSERKGVDILVRALGALP